MRPRIPFIHLHKDDDHRDDDHKKRYENLTEINKVPLQRATEPSENQHRIILVETHLEDPGFETVLGLFDRLLIGGDLEDIRHPQARQEREPDEFECVVCLAKRQHEHINKAGDCTLPRDSPPSEIETLISKSFNPVLE